MAFGGAIDGANLCAGGEAVALSPLRDAAAGGSLKGSLRPEAWSRPALSVWVEGLGHLWGGVGEEQASLGPAEDSDGRPGGGRVLHSLGGEQEERGSGEAAISGAPPAAGIWSLEVSTRVLGLTAPWMLLGTVAIWATWALSAPGAGDWEAGPHVGLEGEGVPESPAAAAAAMVWACRRLSASFFSLGIPGEEHGVRAASLLSLAPGGVAPPTRPGGGVAGVRSSGRGSEDAALALGLFHSPGGVGLRKGSLATEMKALPGVEKGRGSWAGLADGLPGSRAWPSGPSLPLADGPERPPPLPGDDTLSSGFGSPSLDSVTEGRVWERVGLPSGEGPAWENMRWEEEGDRQREGSVPPGPVRTVVGRSRGGGVKEAPPLRPSWLSSEPSSVSSSEESTSWMASCFWRDSRRSARSCLMADSLSFSLLLPGTRPREPGPPSPSWRPSFLEDTECFCRLPFSTPRPEHSIPSLADSWRLCRPGSLCRSSFLKSEWEISRLCLRHPSDTPFFSPTAPPTGEEQGEDEEEESEEASFSADCTLLRRGERGGSPLLGLEIWRASGGDECSLTGKDWPRGWLGDGERCGEVLCGVGEGVRASGDRGMLPADLRRGERYCRWSLGARPWRELGRMWPELAGELGTLELGELLWEELPPTEWVESGVER